MGGGVGFTGGTVSGMAGVAVAGVGAGEAGGAGTGATAFGGEQLTSKRMPLIIKGTNLYFTNALGVNVPQCIGTVKSCSF